ncbi:MAG: hypothetical protein NHB32_21120 [Fischerella sp. CENA71]|nr:hypothetical protein [Fischerella sp. CENA71]
MVMVLAATPSAIEPHQSPLYEGFELFESANVAYIKFARWLKQQQQTMKPKAFKALLAEYGMIRREATKFIKLATVSDRFVPQDLCRLGLMMFSLLTPRYKPLWSEMLDELGSSTYQDEAGLNIPCDMPIVLDAKTSKPASSWRGQSGVELTQDLVDGLRKQMFPAKKRENKKQSSITPAAIDNQDTQARLQRIVSSEGISPDKAVDKALDCYEALKSGQLVWVESQTQASGLDNFELTPSQEAQQQKSSEALEAGEASNSRIVQRQTQNQPIVTAAVQANEDELEQFISSEEVALQQWGLSLGDTVVWADKEHDSMMCGHIYDFTPDRALVDCCLQKPVTIAYAHIKKITPESIESALSDGRSPHSQILMTARNVKALWDVNSIQAEASLNELLKMSWHWKVWIDEQAMSEENRLVFIPGGKDYLSESEVEINTIDHKEIPINPIEEIAKVFRNASDWAEIRTALLTYGYEHKQAAWNLLFEQEKQHFLSLMPPAVQKLSKLKKQGIILDFKEDMTGENFFMKLKSGIEQEVSLFGLDEFVLELEPF